MEKEELKQEMCEHYCKYPNEWDEEKEGLTLVDAICQNCPLEKL